MRIPVNRPRIYDEEETYVVQAIRDGWISSESPFVVRFEEEIAALGQRRHGVAVSNGTAALEIAILSLGLGEGDEVIVPSFTIISCIQAIVKSGAIPVLVDSEIDSWNMDVSQIRSKITKYTKAILMVHMYGLPAKIADVLQIASEFGLAVIEDAAEAIGAMYNGKPCGSFGDVSVMSFYANKHITTGEGGMILTDRSDVFERSKSLRNLCFVEERRFKHYSFGWNYRLSGLQAAFGLGQIQNIESTIATKREVGRIYNESIPSSELYKKPLDATAESLNTYWVYGVVLTPECGMNASEVMDALAARGIGTRPFFYPMHLQPVLLDLGLFRNENYPISTYLGEYGFYLPSGAGNTVEEIEESAQVFLEVINQ